MSDNCCGLNAVLKYFAMPDSLLSPLCLCFTHSMAKACVAPQPGDQRKPVGKEDPSSALTFRGDVRAGDQAAKLTEPKDILAKALK